MQSNVYILVIVLKPVPRAMFYMPLMHAENLELAHLSAEKFAALHKDSLEKRSLTSTVLGRFDKIARIHLNSIKLFGRYPERNKILGRKSTDDEKVYLKG